MKEPTEEQKEKIAKLQKPSDLPADERKRQYAAMRRSFHRDASPALLAKFSMATDAERFLDMIFLIYIAIIMSSTCLELNPFVTVFFQPFTPHPMVCVV